MATTITRRRASSPPSRTLPVSTGTVRRHINTPGNDEFLKTRRRLCAAVLDLRGRIREHRAASRSVTVTPRIS
jgi:hypothetical protein